MPCAGELREWIETVLVAEIKKVDLLAVVEQVASAKIPLEQAFKP